MPGDFTEYMLKQFKIQDEGKQAYRAFMTQYQAFSDSDDVRGAWQSVWKAWSEKLTFVERQQPLAAGRRLMLEWLEERAEKQDFPNHIAGTLTVEKLADGRRFVVYETGKRKKIQQRFQIGWEAAANMSSDEVTACYKLIRALCVEGELQETSCTRDLLSVVKSGFGAIEERLTREEAFRLAHAMRLSPEKTQDFFLRYFRDNNNDEKSYIDVKKSGDLMHLFALQFPETLPYFEQIRYAYQAARERWESANHHAPAEQRAFRAAASGATDYLYNGVLEARDLPWQAEGLSPEARRDAFIQWITSCGETVIDETGREVKTDIILPLLDVRSASATALTRVLARKTLQVALFYDNLSLEAMNPNVEPLKVLPETRGVLDVILKELDAEIILQERWTGEQWASAADALSEQIMKYHNYRFDISSPDETGLDFQDPWQRLLALIDAQKRADRTGVTQEHLNFPVLVAAGDGSMNRRERRRDEDPRLTQVLTGAAEARKSDILQLLLLLYSELWRNEVSNKLSMIRDDDDERERFFLGYGAECLERYRNAAAVLLKKLAGVADFYIAHFTEYTALESILLAATVSWKYSPGNIYLELTVGNKGKHLHPYEEKELPAQEKPQSRTRERGVAR